VASPSLPWEPRGEDPAAPAGAGRLLVPPDPSDPVPKLLRSVLRSPGPRRPLDALAHGSSEPGSRPQSHVPPGSAPVPWFRSASQVTQDFEISIQSGVLVYVATAKDRNRRRSVSKTGTSGKSCFLPLCRGEAQARRGIDSLGLKNSAATPTDSDRPGRGDRSSRVSSSKRGCNRCGPALSGYTKNATLRGSVKYGRGTVFLRDA